MPEVRATLDADRARALCDGHFPGDPLVPGAYLVEAMAEVAARARGRTGELPAEVVRCVFLSAVSPDRTIELRARPDAALVDVEVWTDGRRAARGTFRFAASA